MSWITITEDDIKTGLTGLELAAARSAAKSAGQADPVAEVILNVTREVRGYVANCERNTMGEGQTIPDECLAAAISRCVVELCKRIPGKALLTDERANANKEAIAFLRDVASCRFRIAQPAVASTEEIASTGVKLVNSRPRQNFGGVL